MLRKTLHLVTALNPSDPKKTVLSFEKEMRVIYRKNNTDPCICFSHRDTPPFKTAELVKKKKVDVVIFDSSVSPADIVTIMTAVKRRIPQEDDLPRFIHTKGNQIVTGTEATKDHQDAHESIFH